MDDAAFRDLAFRIFPGSSIVGHDSYGEAKARMLDWIKSLRSMLGPVERWRLACAAAKRVATAHDLPHSEWARQLLDTDLTELLGKLHAAGLAADYLSPDPLTWPPNREPLPEIHSDL